MTPKECAYEALALPELKVTALENTRQLQHRFSYLWQAAHALLPTNAAMASHLLASMMQQARASRVELPSAVLDFVCERCGGLLLPSVSADVRVVPQACKSRVNRRLARQQRRSQPQTATHSGAAPRVVRESLANVVVRLCLAPQARNHADKRAFALLSGSHLRHLYAVCNGWMCGRRYLQQRVRCHRCQHVRLQPGASVVHKPKHKKRARDGNLDDGQSDGKRVKTEGGGHSSVQTATATAAVDPVVAAVPPPSSMFAPPPSPPRKLLDGPKKRKKKKKTPSAAVTAVKSSLSSFLQGLQPSSTRK